LPVVALLHLAALLTDLGLLLLGERGAGLALRELGLVVGLLLALAHEVTSGR
jgi:hypothetical protein